MSADYNAEPILKVEHMKQYFMVNSSFTERVKKKYFLVQEAMFFHAIIAADRNRALCGAADDSSVCKVSYA